MSIEEQRKNISSFINDLIWAISCNIEELDEEFNNLTHLECTERYINIDTLIQAMKKDNLYTPEIETFMENFLKFYND